VASVRTQTLPDWEALLIDDASSDGSARIMADLARDDPRLRALGQGGSRPRGAAMTRNLGIRAARGPLHRLPGRRRPVAPREARPQARAFADGAPSSLVLPAHRRRGPPARDRPRRPRIAYATRWAGNPIGCLTAAYDTRAFGKREMPDIPTRHDYALWLDLLRSGAVAQRPARGAGRLPRPPGLPVGQQAERRPRRWRLLGEQGISPARRAWGFARYGATRIARR
jgi:hypothetical protein